MSKNHIATSSKAFYI